MIVVDRLRFNYPALDPGGEPVCILDGVSFEVPEGTCAAVTGASGSGMTTLCMAAAGLAPRLTGGSVSGRITVGGRDVQTEPPGALADVLGVGLEDPAGQLLNPTVADEIGWGLENLGIPPAEMPARIGRALELMHLGDIPLDQPPQTLSGGQQRRLALAAALALEPRALILDHPSGGLSPLGRAELIAALRELRDRQSLTILFAENDPAVIAALADEVLILEHGRIAARGRPAEIYAAFGQRRFAGVGAPPAGAFAQAVNARRNGSAPPLTCLTLDQALDQVKGYRLNGLDASAGETTPSQPAGNGEIAVQLEAVSYGYRPDQPILKDFNLSIPRGQLAAITGDNGAGKTTLARHLIGLLRPQMGCVRLFGEDIAGQKVSALARQIGFAFQNPELQIFNASVREEVSFGPRNLGLRGEALRAAVEAAIEWFGLGALAETPPAMLSYSGRRLTALAGIAAMDTPILVLDEPTVGLDADGQARVEGWLAERQRAGVTIVLITHDMELAARCAKRAIVMEGGRISADGDPREVFGRGEALARAGLEQPFAAGFAAGLRRPELAADLTPAGAAAAWLEHLA